MKYLLTVLLLFSLTQADEFEHHSKKHIQKELSHIKLKKEQKKELKSILKAFRTDLKSYQKLKKRVQKEKEQLFLEEHINIKRLQQLDFMLNKKAKEIENSFLLQMHHLLTPKQRKQFIRHFDDWEVE